MLQSQQCWLPELHEPVPYEDIEKWKCADGQNFIAHWIEDDKISLSNQLICKSSNQLIAIGPEGDFSPEEIEMALQNDFIPVGLGDTRLRTETAGVAAAVLLSVN